LYQRWSPGYEDYKESSNAIKETFKLSGRLEAALGYYMSFVEDANTEEKVIFYETLPEVPVLYLLGEMDGIAIQEIINEMDEKMPKGSKSILFKDAGHFLHREIFPEFISEVKLFLNTD